MQMKFKLLGITSLLSVCNVSTNAVADNAATASVEAAVPEAVVDSVINDADEHKIGETIASDASANNVDAAAGNAAESSIADEPLTETIEGEAHQEEEHSDAHEFSEAFQIMDLNEDGVLQKEEIITAIERSGHHVEIPPEEYADKFIPKEKSFDMNLFTEMITMASAEEAKEGEMPSLNQQISHLASDVLASYYYHYEDEEEDEEEEWQPSAEDFYNPRNMTFEELEYHLYEWEEGAVGYVSEYHDVEVFERMRNQEDDWYNEDEEEDEEEKKDKKQSTLKDQKHHDDGSKTKVEMRKSNSNHFLNLSNDVAHVVEFYAPWCPHCQHFKWEYIEIAAETKRRTTSTPGMLIHMRYYVACGSLQHLTHSLSFQSRISCRFM